MNRSTYPIKILPAKCISSSSSSRRRKYGHDRISYHQSSNKSRFINIIRGFILYLIQFLPLSLLSLYVPVCCSSYSSMIPISTVPMDVVVRERQLLRIRLQPPPLQHEEQRMGLQLRRAVVAVGGDDREHDTTTNHNDDDHQQQQHVTSYSQRHPKNNNNYYYYSNGNRVSSQTKSAYSYYDYNDDDDDDDHYYNHNNNNKNRQHNNEMNNSYTTKLSDVYWCLLIALGWTIWMIHSIASLRQQQYYNTTTTMLSFSERGMNDTTMTMMHTPNADTMRIFRTDYSTLLFIRGHVLDIIPTTTPIITAPDTPIMKAPTCTVVIDYVVERQQQIVLSPTNTTTTATAAGIEKDKHNMVTTLPTIQNETIPPNELIQIRKHFETTQSNLQVGFGNVELLVLPNDPMCSILKYDYDEYIRQEERIQRVILQEQSYRKERRRKKKRQQLLQRNGRQQSNYNNNTTTTTRCDENSTLPMAILDVVEGDENAMPPSTTDSCTGKTRSPIHIHTTHLDDDNVVVVVVDINKQKRNDTGNEGVDDNDDDDLLGCDIYCTYCDWNYYDQYQWKRLSLFFAILLVLASIIGTFHVVSRMDPSKKYLGWISFGIGLLLLFPSALWIHRIMMACHRWTESEPEKQGYIVQSSTMTSFNHTNGELEAGLSNHKSTNHTGTIPITTTSPTIPSMMTLADACMRPSCTEMMDDICDPQCRNHTSTILLPTSKSTTTIPTEFSYMVPEMSGCYFIHYPKNKHIHHPRSTVSNATTKKRKSKQDGSNRNILDPTTTTGRATPMVTNHTQQSVPPITQSVVMDNTSVVMDGFIIRDDTDQPTMAKLYVSQQQQQNDSASSSSCILQSESSVSSISSNDDTTMKELSIWSSLAHDI